MNLQTGSPPLHASELPWGSAACAARAVRDGDKVVISGCGAAPLDFLTALSARTDLQSVTLCHATAWGDLPHLRAPVRPSHLDFNAYFLPALARPLQKRGLVDYTPLAFSNMESLYRQGAIQADTVAVTCSMPDRDGYCSLGPFVNYLPAALDAARVLIAECSPSWPITGGAARIHASRFHHMIQVSRHPIVAPEVESQPEAERIAAHVASVIEDGATIQIGRGAIPNAIAAALSNHRDLGIHSEMISDWAMKLAESGALTGMRKRHNQGQIVTSFMDGSRRLFDFANNNPDLLMQAIYQVNDPATIAREPDFMAINSAIEVDLSGQINAESIGRDLMSGTGGLLDFAIGAARSERGKFIVALPSTAREGSISRIVAALGSGAAVTVPRSLAHIIVTEHGIADLRGCTLQERAKRLIAIAAPAFRESLSFDLSMSTARHVQARHRQPQRSP